MNILYISISYSPNKDDLYQNLVEALLNNGHKITAVTSAGDVNETLFEYDEKELNIIKVETWNPFSDNLIKKGINQILLSTCFKSVIRKKLLQSKFDLILYATPPVTLASVVKYCKKKFQAKTFLMLKDIFPQNAVDLKMIKKNGLIYKYFRSQEKRYYKYSDYIGCMSKGNKDYIITHNPEINSSKVHVFPNSIKINEIDNLSFHEDKTVFLFGGNLGKPQNIPFLMNIISNLKNFDKAEFIIIGDGTEAKNIIEQNNKEEISNLFYHKEVPQSEYEAILKGVDVGLISLDPNFTIPNIPSKLLTYFKLKKPVFAITDINTDLKDMIQEHNCGWWCDASREKEIIKIIKEICENKEEQKLRGKNGYNYLIEEFDVKDSVKKIEKFYNEA